ncbi:MAG: SUMF1/EgtB/PvdO family nonheme iron enzyme [Bacteroidota bacterium]
MIHIPGGTFMMGGENVPDNAKPEHLVSLDEFSLCRFPVSQRLWEEVIGREPSSFQNPSRPVEGISWNEITKEFLPALHKKTGYENYCLPTQAHWEYAAGEGEKGALLSRRRFEFSGSDDLKEVGWFRNNSLRETQPMGLKRPNALGLFGMSCNVWEWCQDWYNENYYQTLKDQHREKPARNPEGPKKGDLKVIRGGAWDIIHAHYFRPSSRYYRPPSSWDYALGFRLARYSPI